MVIRVCQDGGKKIPRTDFAFIAELANYRR